METKLRAALYTLLLINFGSAEHDGDHATASPTSKSPLGAESVAPVAKSLPDSGSSPTSHAPNSSETNTSSSGNSKVSNNTTTEPISVTSESRKDNATEVSFPVDGEKSETQRNQPPSLPSAPPTENPITHIPTSPADTSTTHHTSSADVTATPSPDHNNTHNTSHHSEPPLSDSTTQSHQPSPTTTPSVTSSPTSEPPKPQTSPSSTTTTTTTQSTSASSTSSSHVATTTAHTSQSSSTAHPKTTSSPPSSPSARTHSDNPSQLNMGGDAKKDSPALDPLLAGLVSAFIITAVIITLLLFLKLRRRDNRPEFRRLQDLPMDDMMEDTPLSMYNY
uniref:Uncharacterized protein n=1 Tax=Amphiprion percula TaxID=161767 RepID=A0A3P8SUG6_AMPPE